MLQLVASAQTTVYWTGSQDDKWENAGNWVGGTPSINTHVVIGERAISNQPKIVVDNQGNGKQTECLSLTIGGAYEATLTIESEKWLHIETNLNIRSNGTFRNRRTKVLIKGDWKNDGAYIEEAVGQGNKWTYIPSVEFIGTSQKITGSSESRINHLEIKSYVTLESNLSVALPGYNYGNLIVHNGAVIDPADKKVTWTSVGGFFDLKNGATAKVKALNYLDNYSIRPTGPYDSKGNPGAEHTSIIDYAGTIEYQNIDDKIIYQRLVVSGSGVKSLLGNTTVSAGAPDTEVDVREATLDLKTYTLTRQAAGGSLKVAAGATLKVGGLRNGPDLNFANRLFDANSTVDYYGANQTVQHNTYGHLMLSNTGVKTMPATPMTIAGNLTSTGTAQYTAAGALTVGENVIVGEGTSFNGGPLVHTVSGNWVNSGTFTPGGSTIIFNGTRNTTITGVTTFNSLTINKTAGANTVTLHSNVTATTLNMTSGEMRTGANRMIILGNRTGDGWVVGTVNRQHAFSAGVAYAFNGPYATIAFSGG
ncbi:MAG TPA: hypothetical protein VIG72_06800, partial [Pontibacter sp.]